MSNVTPIRRPGALSRLLRGCGLDDKLPPIQTPKRVDVMPVTVAVPVSASTPRECICPTCRIFECEPNETMCPRCTLKGELREMNAARRREHYESIDREISERDELLRRAEAQVLDDANMIRESNEAREERSRD